MDLFFLFFGRYFQAIVKVCSGVLSGFFQSVLGHLIFFVFIRLGQKTFWFSHRCCGSQGNHKKCGLDALLLGPGLVTVEPRMGDIFKVEGQR